MVFSRHNISRRKQAMTYLTLSQQRSKIELLYDESTYVLDGSISFQQIYPILVENYVEQNAVFLEYLNFCKAIFIKNLQIHPKYYDKGHGVL